MGFWEALAEGGVTGLFKGAGEFAKDIRAAITGEEALTAEQRTQLLTQAAAMEASILQADLAVIQGQTAINVEEAKSDNLFKSGWRPAVGWVCVFGLALFVTGSMIVPWYLTISGTPFVPPKIDYEPLWGVMMGMLGLGGFRTFEKVKNVS